jgi:hypothetical protein
MIWARVHWVLKGSGLGWALQEMDDEAAKAVEVSPTEDEESMTDFEEAAEAVALESMEEDKEEKDVASDVEEAAEEETLESNDEEGTDVDIEEVADAAKSEPKSDVEFVELELVEILELDTEDEVVELEESMEEEEPTTSVEMDFDQDDQVVMVDGGWQRRNPNQTAGRGLGVGSNLIRPSCALRPSCAPGPSCAPSVKSTHAWLHSVGFQGFPCNLPKP